METKKPMSKLYFIKKPTEASLRQGRKPVIGRIKKVNPKTIEKQQQFLEKVYKRRQVPAGKKKGFLKEAVDADAQQRLTAIAKTARERKEAKLADPLEYDAQKDIVKSRVKQKSIVGRQEELRQQVIENARQEMDRVAEERKTTALLALPPALERARLAIERLEPLQQQQIVALHNIAPQVSQNIVDEWARRFPASVLPIPEPPQLPPASPVRQLPDEPPLALTAEQEAISTQFPNVRENLTNLRTLFNLPSRQYRTLIVRLGNSSSAGLEELLQATRSNLSTGFATQIEDLIRQKQGVGAGLKFKGRKAKGGALSTSSTEEETGGGFFGDAFGKIKDLAKSGVAKLVEKVQDDPIGMAKKAYELGQKGREEYKKQFGKKEKGGKMFIPKKHQKIIHRLVKKTHGAGFADMFMKSFKAPKVEGGTFFGTDW